MVSQSSWNKKIAWVRLEALAHDALCGDRDRQSDVLALLFDMRTAGIDFETTERAIHRATEHALALSAVELTTTDIYTLEKIFRKVRNG